MIIARIEGGLGNQMFQYACGLSLAHRTRASLVLDASHFFGGATTESTVRKFELGIFRLNARVRGQTRFERALLGTCRTMAARLSGGGFMGPILPTYFSESDSAYRPEFEYLGTRVYLNGYWQSYRYFEEVDRLVRQDFTFPEFADAANLGLAEEIVSKDSVGIHVRRGDYLKGKAVEVHGACSADYYNAAIRHILRETRDPKIYIFSDDPRWAESAISAPCDVELVEHNTGGASFRDMQLMSLCRHQIIANSTFSWWAGWLNRSPDKIVVAPRRWYANAQMNDLTEELIPERWIRL